MKEESITVKREAWPRCGKYACKRLDAIVVLKDKGDHKAKITVLEGEMKPYTTVSQQHRDTFFISCIGQEMSLAA